jgi:ABC-type dipeptide/oligopeptide/nickel transport system permease subunit
MLLILPILLLTETALSFLGVGLQEPEASWGSLMTDVNDKVFRQGHTLVIFAPVFAIILFIFGIRLLSNKLRESIPAGAGKIIVDR